MPNVVEPTPVARLQWKPGAKCPWALGAAAIVEVLDQSGNVIHTSYASATTAPGVLWIMPPAGPRETYCVQDPDFVGTHAGAGWCADERPEVRANKLGALRTQLLNDTRHSGVEGFRMADYEKVAKELMASTGRMPEPHIIHAEVKKRGMFYSNALCEILDPVNSTLHREIVDAHCAREAAQEQVVSKAGKRKNFRESDQPISDALSAALLARLQTDNNALLERLDRQDAEIRAMKEANAAPHGSRRGRVARPGDGVGRAADGEPSGGES